MDTISIFLPVTYNIKNKNKNNEAIRRTWRRPVWPLYS